ncbi:cyclic GMP-AMP synthase [Phodopus roborovskii]|uniref:Cyclic GMP-AMP synthase n=1 Tax=Phodopus roborovskii TaxID=109678 RepID=A0AAU9YXY3_PHORO|nr:cyclic GMP-AMP synthase [Phodopus roborovskii]CAH6780191.1 Cgas [Phodopus roborovskii]
MEGQCLRPTASRAMKLAANRATTEANRAEAALSHVGSRGPQRGARSRRAEPDGDPMEKPRARAPRTHPGRASVRPKELQISAMGVAGDAELPTAPEPRLAAVLDPQLLADPEVSVSRGLGHRRGARSMGKQRTPRGSRKEHEETPDKRLKKVLENLKLKRNEISVAAEVVNEVVGHLLSRMRNRESEFKGVQQLNTGSYYEHVKISAPNEFDVMFKLDVPRIQLQEYYDTGAFYLVKLGRIPRGNPLGNFLVGEILSASKMLSKFREIIKEEVKRIKGVDVSVEMEKPGSPAVTLLIRNPEEISVDIILALESKGSWPVSTKEGLPIQNWLGTKVRTNLRREPFYLVPKNAKVGNGFQGKTWRLSFSHTEKYILNNHGIEKTCCESSGVKCCRKDCLKLMKYLLEQLKKEYEELDDFCSYHVKTAIFHMWTENPQDSQWDPKHISACFDNFLTFFVECLKTEKLMHYFIPKFNLFSQELIDKNSKEFLLKRIEYERNNGFPIFNKF